MQKEIGKPNDDPSSAPESGTGVDATSGNKPSERSNNLGPTSASDRKHGAAKVEGSDDPSAAGEER